MKWRRGQSRAHIEDRRGQSSGGGIGGFGGLGRGGSIPIPGGAGGVGGGLLVVIVLVVLFATGVLGGGGTSSSNSGARVNGAPDPKDQLGDFVAFVVNDVQDFWQKDFRTDGRTYQVTDLVLFTGQTQSGCGLADASVGPFYCPADRKVYLEEGFFQELADRFQAPGDFAEAYVIAHEFGHHIQTLLGTEGRVRDEMDAHPSEKNELSVRLELQADCYAGVWGHSAYQQGQLSDGDLQEGLEAAASVGDDRIQRSAGQRVDPETWTHGSAAQRSKWFRIGFDSGDAGECDTFSASI